MKSVRLAGLTSSVLVGLLQSPVFAADALSDPLTSDTDALFQDIPSVYSASKYEQKVTKAPASISIVTADEIKKWGYRTFGDILSSLKGFYNTNDRNYGYAGARGFGVPGDYNSRILLLIDGHRFNDNIYDQFDTSEGFPVDLDVIERIEVVRGPGSALYGANAFLGVINVITKRGRDQHGVSVKASYGSNDAYKTSVSIGDRFKNGLETFLSGSFYNSQGFDKLYYSEYDDPATNNGVSVGNDAEQAKKLLAKASFGDFALQGLYENRNKDIPTAEYLTSFNNPSNTVDQATFIELKYDHTFENQLNLQSRLSYNNYRYTGNYPYTYSTTNKPDVVINKDLAYGEWWRAELEASKVLWEDHRLTVGGQYQDNFHQFLTNYDRETYVASDTSTYQYAIFIQDDYSILDSLTLNAGVRLDYFSIFGETVNPRVGLIYNPWQNSTVKLLYGTAFRAPNQNELNYIGTGITNSLHLQPEKLQTLELVLEHYFTSQLRVELNLFQTNIDKVIALTAIDNVLLQQQNIGNYDAHGIEAQIENNWLNGWQGRISYSWQQTKDKATNQIISNSPEHLLKLNLIAPLWTDKVFLGFETQVMSARKTSSGEVAGHVVSNLTLFTQKWLKGLELSGGVYNLFDQRYFDPVSDAYRQNGIQQDALTFRVKASLDF
ncbi:MAG: TonB-dependent receptor [Methylococcaceae bacterium]|nr:TonB-dependent receptor [Methylococcaceae bacterium]